MLGKHYILMLTYCEHLQILNRPQSVCRIRDSLASSLHQPQLNPPWISQHTIFSGSEISYFIIFLVNLTVFEGKSRSYLLILR